MGADRLKADFDRIIEREHTHAVKFDARQAVFGTADVTPLWVADMDFAVPEAVTRALTERARHPVYGYTLFPDSLYQALIDWFRVRHGWVMDKGSVLMAPGVVPSLHAAAMAFAGPGEGVIVQPPVYFPFFSAAAQTGRRLIENPLQLRDGRYEMDLDHLEACARDGARLLILCSPHNPVGRVWSAAELESVLEIARQYNIVVLADEIHCDLTLPGRRHTVLQTLARDGDRVITAVAPSKTFNIPGLGLSSLVVPEPADRSALKRVFESMHMGQANPFSIAAFEAAYREGAEWLDQLMAYLEDTRHWVTGFLQEKLPEIGLIQPEATCLLWLDCRKLELEDDRLKAFFIQQAQVGMNPGAMFGEGGSGFMRMNIGTRRGVIEAALERIHRAVRALDKTDN